MFKKYESRKVAALAAAVFLVLAALFLLLSYLVNQRVKVIDVSGCEIDTGEVVCKIEEVGTFYNYISTKGYAYIPGEDINEACIQVLMYDAKRDVYYELPTETVLREDITQEINDGCNYDYCGFQTASYKRNLKTNDGKWMLLYECNGRKLLVDPEKQEEEE